MNAFFIEGGYTINTGIPGVPSIQPYVRYQFWDKAVNAEGNNTYTFFTTGFNFYLNQDKTASFRLDYENNLTWPDYVDKDASLLIVRLQMDLEFGLDY